MMKKLNGNLYLTYCTFSQHSFFIFWHLTKKRKFIIIEFISPNFIENTINQIVLSKKLSITEAKEYTTLTSSIWKNISDSLSFGVVIGAIVAYILKPKTPVSTIKSN